MKPAIWTDAFVELEPEEALERLFHVGWKTLELAEKHWRDLDKREEPQGDFLSLKNLCKTLGISIVQMHGPIFNLCEEPSKLDVHMEEARRSIRWAGILGVRWVVFHPGSAPMAEDEEAAEEVRRKNLDVFRVLVGEATRSHVGLAVENAADDGTGGRRTFGSTPPELLWLVRNVGPERMGVCWDTGHANIQKLNPYRAIKALGKHLVATHIADNDTSGDQHLLPFEGNADWKAVLTALREINYTGLFNLEIGGAVHKVPLPVREAKLRYALELTEALVEGRLW